MDIEVKYYMLGRSTARDHAEALALYHKIERDRETAIVYEAEQGWEVYLNGESKSACWETKEEAIESLIRYFEGRPRGW